jgi:pimeloyl-ACP methyl ester carboxylesterase
MTMQLVASDDGTQIAYESFGEGPPVLLVGGALCDRNSSLPLARELANHGLSGVTYDRRGRGDSTDAGGPGIDNEVADIAALVRALGRPAALYGHSSGAALALHAAARGIETTHLILHEAPYNLDDPHAREASARYRDELDVLLGADDAAGAALHFLRTVGAPEEVVAGMRAEPWWPGMVATAPTLVHESEVMGDRQGGTVPADILRQVAVPTLVVYGDASPPWMLEVARQLVDGLPDATLRILEGEEHVVAPEVLAPVLATFLAGRAVGSA